MGTTAVRHSAEQRRQSWTNRSVLALAANSDPVEAVTRAARSAALKAIQAGWHGPPYDPFALAELLKISVEPRQDVVDARTTCGPGTKFRIEFNPNRSAARINFSVAHEIVHTFFPDCAEATRNRYTHAQMKGNDWELEVLCNVGAAELLMPVGSFRPPDDAPITIDHVTSLQRKYLVSTEAVLLRTARLTAQSCFVFAAHLEEPHTPRQFRIDYAVPSRTCAGYPPSGLRLPSTTVLGECKAIGFTAKRDEEWRPSLGLLHVECLGIAPLPGYVYPRVVGLAKPAHDGTSEAEKIQFLRGSATDPRGDGPRMIVQVVNDKAITWRGSFAWAVRKRWPNAQKEFTHWVFENRKDFRLGTIHICPLDNGIELASLVAQHGYGPSLFPRIDYSALQTCLEKVASRAAETNASVHMPRIGCGEARGGWNIVAELIDQTLSRSGIKVTVYNLPDIQAASVR